MRVEKQLNELENEIKALKVSFAQSAAGLSYFAYTINFSTSKRAYSISNGSPWDPLSWSALTRYLEEGGVMGVGPYIGEEIVQVTFNSNDGSNVLADLELGNFGSSLLAHTIRENYAGGARWKISCSPNVTLVTTPGVEYRWSPNSFSITVRSIMPGTLEVKQL